MPIYLRRFYLKKLIEYKKKEEEEIKKASQSNKPSSPKIRR
jgi:hypothetical protein|tara:strand:+ start:757 stop:879 length:123 start_codon:yes stop_codon:yes gene_type:complete